MDEETANKFVRLELHRFITFVGFGPVIGPFERDAVLIATDKSAVRDGHAMGISREIGEHSFGT